MICRFRHSLVSKIMVAVGGILLLATFSWSYLVARSFEPYWIWTGVTCLTAMAALYAILVRLLVTPVQSLIEATQDMVHGEYAAIERFDPHDEIGFLAHAVKQMGQEIRYKQQQINKQKDAYQKLFELVPCIISVQDRNYQIISYNQEFSRRFAPKPGDFCYAAYKGLAAKCKYCPVEKTFEDGHPHYSEETGMNRDGSMTHWIVKTAPVKNAKGDIIAAMEMSLDITQIKQLENKLARSEQEYYAIFNNIPNPIFVLDGDTLDVIHCNKSVSTVYGYGVEEVLQKSFLDFFVEEDRSNRLHISNQIKISSEMNNAKHITKSGEIRYVNICIAPSEYPGGQVFFVTTTDVTKRLETEMQLLQTAKMATLGEMATGIAHELNQPLAVIKTASNYFMKKVNQNQPIAPDILLTLSREIDTHVDRASNIINHLRQFGRKSDTTLAPVAVNTVLRSAFEMFHQQLKLREIRVEWELDPHLPEIMAESSRLEQVFINLLINARDAIEKRAALVEEGQQPALIKRITLTTYSQDDAVFIEVWDNGIGIPCHLIEKVFQPFFTTKKVGEGTGLGLSISYGIIKDFKGDVHIRSTTKEGTCFVIQFPSRSAP